MLKNTDRLRPAALTFLEKGHYTSSLPGTKDYYDFWDEEKNRCMYGYEVDELKVTGFHYFYLNYFLLTELSTKNYLTELYKLDVSVHFLHFMTVTMNIFMK